MRFQVPQLGGVDDLGLDARRPLSSGEAGQRGHAFGVGGDDDPALRLELDGAAETAFGSEVVPEAGGEQRKVQLGPRLLVGDEQVALTGAGGTAGHRAPVEDEGREARPGEVQGTGGAHHSGADDHNIAGQSLAHASTMSHVSSPPRAPRLDSPAAERGSLINSARLTVLPTSWRLARCLFFESGGRPGPGRDGFGATAGQAAAVATHAHRPTAASAQRRMSSHGGDGEGAATSRQIGHGSAPSQGRSQSPRCHHGLRRLTCA